jgi:transcriptional regulator with XRE-family HTH domain
MQQVLGKTFDSILRPGVEEFFDPAVSFLPASAIGMSETFAARLRRIRDEKGFTVPQLAGAVGMSPSAIRQLESGQIKNPGFALGLRLANQLSVDAHYLAFGEGFSLTDRLDSLEARVTKLEKRSSSPATRR